MTSSSNSQVIILDFVSIAITVTTRLLDELTAEAIKTLKERDGSSLPAIKKFIAEKHGKVGAPAHHHVTAL